MRLTRKKFQLAIILLACVFIHFYSADNGRVESGYTGQLFPLVSRGLRIMFGWIPFSIGDIFYGLVGIWLVVKLFNFCKKLLHQQTRNQYKTGLFLKLSNLVLILGWVYIIFNIFWGINYNRVGIASQLGLQIKKYSTEDLKEMNCLLLEKVNRSKAVLIQQNVDYPSNSQLRIAVKKAYDNLSLQYPYLAYRNISFKTSLWGWLGNYAGFTGYYNPFTGEAQLNTTVPLFIQPYTACHEVAHQIGYAKEMEANFVGYLAAANSNDILLHYSVYLDLFSYANRNLYFTDSITAKLYRRELSPAVVKDLKEWFAFSKRHQNPAEPVIRWLYGKFLERNQQPQGILSYDEVTGFLIAYQRKFGKI